MEWLVSGRIYRMLVYEVVGERGVHRRLVCGIVSGGRDVQKASI